MQIPWNSQDSFFDRGRNCSLIYWNQPLLSPLSILDFSFNLNHNYYDWNNVHLLEDDPAVLSELAFRDVQVR